MECLIAFVIPILSFLVGIVCASLVTYGMDGISTKQFLFIFICTTGTAHLTLTGVCRYALRVKITFLSAGLFPLTAIVTSLEQSHSTIVRRPITSQAFPDYISLSPPNQEQPNNEDLTLALRNLSSTRYRL
jgi:hypothetical protein